MLGRSLNFIKTIKCFGRYIPTLENKLNSVTRFISWHYQQCTNSSTLPIQKLYSSPDPKKDKQLKYIQLKVCFNQVQFLFQNLTFFLSV